MMRLISSYRLNTYSGVVFGVVAISFAAILIRIADAPPMTIAAYRMGIASLVVVPTTAVFAHDKWQLSRGDLLLCLLGGFFLAVHFGAWITSLEHTSVASSVVLVTASPLMVALSSRLFLNEPLERRVLIGIALGLGGSLIIASGDLAKGGLDDLLGDALALLGAVAVTGYYLVGRKVRSHVSLMPYLSVVYAVSAVLLVACALITRAPFTGHSGQTYLFMVLVAIIPQLLGHSTLNWALARVSATLVSVAVMAEPLVSTVLALTLLREVPPATSFIGGAVILIGIYTAVRRQPR
jgi:drug/metabolite transporter (DMT)-like permease